MNAVGGPLRACPFALVAGGAILAALLLAPAPPAAADRAPSAMTLDPTSPQLEVDPETWWMVDGNSTPLSAAWVDVPPGCGLEPLWFRWSAAGAPATGSINSTSSANATFLAASAETGTTTVRARSAGTLDCGGNLSVVVGSAEANITVAAPVLVQNLSMVPDVVRAYASASMRGNVSGGEPPYLFRVTWGDGSTTSVAVAAPGSFSIPHLFSAGTFAPSVVVTDSSGLVAGGAVDESLTASNSTAVGLGAVSSEVDIGVETTFNGTVLGDPTPQGTEWSCGGSPERVAVAAAFSTNFSCSFSAPGPTGVAFAVLESHPDPEASTTLLETVVPRPLLGAVIPTLTAEVGQPSAVGFNVSGGVPPFRLGWQQIGSALQGTLSFDADGQVLLPIAPEDPGSLELVAWLIDGDGIATSNATVQVVVDPALNDSAASARVLTTSGAEVEVTASVRAGVPPFLWVFTPSSPPSNESGPEGTLDSVGAIAWQANFTVEGGISFEWTVVDAAGAFSCSTLESPTVPRLSGNLSVVPGGSPAPGTFSLETSLSGGLPPFRLAALSTVGDSWNRTLAADGTANLTFSLGTGGPLDLRVTVTDSLGAGLNWSLDVPVTPLPPDPARTPTAPNVLPGTIAAVALLGTIGVGGGYLLVRRRRSRSSPPPAPDPVAVLRRIVEPADGADRGTVELLAEEAGVGLDEVRRTIDHLIANGTLRAETDPDGGEVLAWSAPDDR